jgi:hypothetical protein
MDSSLGHLNDACGVLNEPAIPILDADTSWDVDRHSCDLLQYVPQVPESLFCSDLGYIWKENLLRSFIHSISYFSSARHMSYFHTFNPCTLESIELKSQGKHNGKK